MRAAATVSPCPDQTSRAQKSKDQPSILSCVRSSPPLAPIACRLDPLRLNPALPHQMRPQFLGAARLTRHPRMNVAAWQGQRFDSLQQKRLAGVRAALAVHPHGCQVGSGFKRLLVARAVNFGYHQA